MSGRPHARSGARRGRGQADVGLGIEAAALAYGLGFVFLATEPYDLVIPAEMWDTAPVQALAAWLNTEDAHAVIAGLGGYELGESGRASWVR